MLCGTFLVLHCLTGQWSDGCHKPDIFMWIVSMDRSRLSNRMICTCCRCCFVSHVPLATPNALFQSNLIWGHEFKGRSLYQASLSVAYQGVHWIYPLFAGDRYGNFVCQLIDVSWYMLILASHNESPGLIVNSSWLISCVYGEKPWCLMLTFWHPCFLLVLFCFFPILDAYPLVN